MSGNPFRRAPQTAARLSDEPTKTSNEPRPPAAVAIKSSKKRTKHVHIISPGSSPTDYHDRPRRLSDGGIGSPPPERLEPDSSGDDDQKSVASADDDLEQAVINTRKNSGSDPLSPPLPPLVLGGPPKNPFAKDGVVGNAPQVSFGISTTRTRLKNEVDEDDTTERLKSTGRQAMDVDAFKNMLLTGSATPSPPVGQYKSKAHDTSSGTDTSSVSKNSIFETPSGLMPESPRTSLDDKVSDHEQHDDDEGSSLMGSNRPQEIAPFLPPKPKIKTKGPQTVSFADFDETIPSPIFDRASPLTPRVPADVFALTTPPLERASCDINKPLPPPPHEPNNTATSSPIQLTELEPTLSVQQSIPESPAVRPNETLPTQQKKAPPPPPASRRQGQSAPQPAPLRARARSTSSLDSASVAEQDETERPKSSDSSAAKAPAPPPPPSRRGNSAPQAQSSTSIESSQHGSLPDQPATQTSKAPIPPPPPRRQPPSATKQGGRDASSSSWQSLPRNDSSSSFQTATHSQIAPPAPPPRRAAGGGGSSRNSYDGSRRESGHSFTSVRSESMNSQQNEQLASTDAIGVSAKEPPRDILADMTAFQAEVDALRAKAYGSA